MVSRLCEIRSFGQLSPTIMGCLDVHQNSATQQTSACEPFDIQSRSEQGTVMPSVIEGMNRARTEEHVCVKYNFPWISASAATL
jgi:hypothetical protein